MSSTCTIRLSKKANLYSGHMNTSLHVIMMQSHVASDAWPSHFSECNIEKLGMGLGDKAI